MLLLFGIYFSYRISSKFNLVCRVYNSVQYCVSYGRITNCIIPAFDRKL